MTAGPAPCAFVWHGAVLEVATGPTIGALVAPARKVRGLPAPITVELGPVARRWRPARPRRTFDAAPLLRQAVLTVDGRGDRVAEVLGTSLRQVARWRAGVRLYEETADRCATALGLHPSTLWPDW